ncbi:MAG: PepSY-associated TM helix domain-containing protein [Vicinamibacterales bacterium]
MNQAWWRRWHRWVGFVGGMFLIFAAVTGVLVAGTEFFGEEEALREATRDLVSPVTTASPASAWHDPLARALATAAREAGGAPIDRIVMQFKGDAPTVDVFLGKPTGGEDRRLVLSARTGDLIRTEGYVDKPLLHRIHSGEAFGDGGLVFAMAWGTGLAFLGVSGLLVYVQMRRRNPTGWQKVFW